MVQRKKKDLATIRRRVEDDGDGEGPDPRDLDEDDSFSDDSTQDDELNNRESSGSQNSEYASPTSPTDKNELTQQMSSDAKVSNKTDVVFTKITSNRNSDLDMMLNGLNLSDEFRAVAGVHFDELAEDDDELSSSVVIKSTVNVNNQFESPQERRRREHEEYKKKRQEDPAFVPNRGAFFMHDHRHSGPAANGFRPFGRGRSRGRLGYRGSFAPHHNSTPHPTEPSNEPWTHDMHEVISEPVQTNLEQSHSQKNISNVNTQVTAITSKALPPNRALSVAKSLGIVQIRVALPSMSKPITIPGVTVKQYTQLPDHRPPLRSDKAVRISLPDHPPRYTFPAVDRSFIFIPREMRPNQQGFGGRGRGRSVFGSGGGYSRRTSVFGGSMFGSGYSPSIAPSRRSSLAREISRDTLPSPNGSAISRSQVAVDSSKPVVRLPPLAKDAYQQNSPHPKVVASTDNGINQGPISPPGLKGNLSLAQSNNPNSKSITSDEQPKCLTMYQPKPQKAVSVADIESPNDLQFNPPQQHQQPFHQQVPSQVTNQANGNTYHHENMLHSRNASYPSQTSTGTPLSQIPERAIHAQPFQPNPYQQQQQLYLQPYHVIPPLHGYYYPPVFNSAITTSSGATSFGQISSQQPQAHSLSNHSQSENPQSQVSLQNLVAQEVNGMVYYYDAAQIPAVATYPAFQQLPSYPMQHVGGLGMEVMSPNPDGLYYTQAPQGVMYYPL